MFVQRWKVNKKKQKTQIQNTEQFHKSEVQGWSIHIQKTKYHTQRIISSLTHWPNTHTISAIASQSDLFKVELNKSFALGHVLVLDYINKSIYSGGIFLEPAFCDGLLTYSQQDPKKINISFTQSIEHVSKIENCEWYINIETQNLWNYFCHFPPENLQQRLLHTLSHRPVVHQSVWTSAWEL